MDKCCPGALPVDRCSGVIVAYAHPAAVAVVKKGGGYLVPSPAQGLHAAVFVVCSCSIWCDKRVGAEVHVMSLCGFAALKAWFLWGPHSRRQWQVTLNRTSPTLVNLRHLTDSGGGCSHRGWEAFGASQAGGGASMVPVLPPGMGVLSQAVAVAVWCTPGVPVCRGVQSAGRLVGESVECVGCLAQSAGRDPGFWWRRTRRGVKWRRLSACRDVDHDVDGL